MGTYARCSQVGTLWVPKEPLQSFSVTYSLAMGQSDPTNPWPFICVPDPGTREGLVAEALWQSRVGARPCHLGASS